MESRWNFWPVFLLLFCLAACMASVDERATLADTPVPLESATPRPSQTVVWFPATPTNPPAAVATILPTPDMRPGIGELLFMENFHEPSAWGGLSHSDAGSVALEEGQLTIAVNQAKTRLVSPYSQIVPANAYVEITARTNLCSGGDEYGLLFRMNSNLKMYRYALTCDGQVQLARVADGVVTYPKSWTPSGDVPRGAPGVTHLAVWLNGKEMRFFLNDAYQFSVRDPAVVNGRLGVYARTSGEQTISVSFQDLAVYSLEPAD